MYNKQFGVKMSDKSESQKAAKGKKGTRGEEKEVRTCIRTCAMKSLEPLIRSLFFFLFFLFFFWIYNNVVATIIIFTPLEV